MLVYFSFSLLQEIDVGLSFLWDLHYFFLCFGREILATKLRNNNLVFCLEKVETCSKMMSLIIEQGLILLFALIESFRFGLQKDVDLFFSIVSLSFSLHCRMKNLFINSAFLSIHDVSAAKQCPCVLILSLHLI